MKRRLLALLLGLLTACPNQPRARPSMPGEFLGSFAFTGTLVGPEGSPGGGPGTTCLLDGGPIAAASSISFYAFLSQEPDSGVIWWFLNGGSGVVDGGLAGSLFWLSVSSSTPPLAGCGCVGSILEKIQGSQVVPGGMNPEGGLDLPVLQLSGRLDDHLAPDPTQSPVCSEDAGLGCGLECDLVYALTAVPGQPPPGQ
jgi:hypothetical protein